jgi:hypothetical protein
MPVGQRALDGLPCFAEATVEHLLDGDHAHRFALGLSCEPDQLPNQDRSFLAGNFLLLARHGWLATAAVRAFTSNEARHTGTDEKR